jgi:hypothetical protein
MKCIVTSFLTPIWGFLDCRGDGFYSLLSFSLLTKLSSPWDVKQKPGLMSILVDTSNKIDNISTIQVIWDIIMHNRSCKYLITHQFTLVMGEVGHSLQAWKSSNGYPCELVHYEGGQHLLPSSR